MKYLHVALTFVLVTAASATAQTTLTQDQALRLAFPAPLKIERRTAYLDEAQLKRARELAGGNVEMTQRVVTYYVASDRDGVKGTAYFDSHRVRTLREVLMIVVDPEWKIERVEVLRFGEPPEYQAPDNWLDQFEDQRLSNDLTLKRSIVPMTGATLTANAVTNAARRTLALHAIISTSSKK